MNSMNALCPLDGRYAAQMKEVAKGFSEKEFLRRRIEVEIEYLVALERVRLVKFTASEKELLRAVYLELNDRDANLIKQIETRGVKGINNGKKTDHDVKAVELFLRHRFRQTTLRSRLEMFHICLTSEDVNNLAITLMVNHGLRQQWLPTMLALIKRLVAFAEEYRNIAMPGRTHGQYAVPTTMGKEFIVFATRLTREVKRLSSLRLNGKLNGAVGNFNAHHSTYPTIDWTGFSKTFVESFNLTYNPITTQIEPHDSLSNILQSVKHVNTILLGLVQDIWGYISDGYLTLKVEPGIVGSSTMPQKVNPIKFENAEGNLGISNSLLEFISSKILVSRFQRDLSDSTVLRWIGVPFGCAYLAYTNILRGLDSIQPNVSVLEKELHEHWEMLAEPIQQILRRENVADAYNLLKEKTQGKAWTKNDIEKFVELSSLSRSVKQEILALRPNTYLGIASELTDEAIDDIRKMNAAIIKNIRATG